MENVVAVAAAKAGHDELRASGGGRAARGAAVLRFPPRRGGVERLTDALALHGSRRAMLGRVEARAPIDASRRTAAAIAASLALHALVLAWLAFPATPGGRSPGAAVATLPLVTRLMNAPMIAATPLLEPLPPAPAITPLSADAAPTLVPLPSSPLPMPKPKAPVEGQGGAHELDASVPLEAALARQLQMLHPDAVRTSLVFIIAPAPAYPAAALKEQRQHHQDVVVVVHEDGRVAALEGTLGETMFDRAIRQSLREARAEPVTVDGKPALAWALLRFTFDYVGPRG